MGPQHFTTSLVLIWYLYNTKMYNQYDVNTHELPSSFSFFFFFFHKIERLRAIDQLHQDQVILYIPRGAMRITWLAMTDIQRSE